VTQKRSNFWPDYMTHLAENLEGPLAYDGDGKPMVTAFSIQLDEARAENQPLQASLISTSDWIYRPPRQRHTTTKRGGLAQPSRPPPYPLISTPCEPHQAMTCNQGP
jgi:hypothetical protein